MSSPPDHLVARIVRSALLEDLGAGDITTGAIVEPGRHATARIAARRPAVISGLRPAHMAFLTMDPRARVDLRARDGDDVPAGGTILTVDSTAAAILAAERTALNFLARLSGIATLTRRCLEMVAGTRAGIYDTRKTTPGLRGLEREAVRAGGGRNHRQGLYDAILIKDNHVILTVGVEEAVRRARQRYGKDHPIEVEIDRVDLLTVVLDAGASIVLLDNMNVQQLEEAVAVRDTWLSRNQGRTAQLEASGGITIESLRAVAVTGVDRISLGVLTHSAPAIDLTLDLDPVG